jgi:predicted HAD superfamily Cof-like phosphohydrolase
MIEDVFEFNEKVIGVSRERPECLSETELIWLRQAFREESQEIADAFTKGDLVGMVDGCLDMAYFAIGGLKRMGLTTEQAMMCFEAVHKANMRKAKGKQAKRGDMEEDAVKPEDFVAPDELIRQILSSK